jgi:hypothetical protein
MGCVWEGCEVGCVYGMRVYACMVCMCVCSVCVVVYVSMHVSAGPNRSQKGSVKYTGAKVTGDCMPPAVGSRNQILVFWKNSNCS